MLKNYRDTRTPSRKIYSNPEGVVFRNTLVLIDPKIGGGEQASLAPPCVSLRELACALLLVVRPARLRKASKAKF